KPDRDGHGSEETPVSRRVGEAATVARRARTRRASRGRTVWRGTGTRRPPSDPLVVEISARYAPLRGLPPAPSGRPGARSPRPCSRPRPPRPRGEPTGPSRGRTVPPGRRYRPPPEPR